CGATARLVPEAGDEVLSRVIASGREVLTRVFVAGDEVLTRGGDGAWPTQTLPRCQPAWLLAWLISCRQAFNSRLQVMGRYANT
ncbi:hypothetical protein NGB58_27900, partial [Escherichia coli]|nr:hypothetical protein [Escherichia coli]